MAVNPATIQLGAIVAGTAYNILSGERNASRARKDTKAQNALNKEESGKIAAAQAGADTELKLQQKKTQAGLQRARFNSKNAAFREAQGASTGPSSTLG